MIPPSQGLILATVACLSAGALYASLLQLPRFKWLADEATELSVVIGVGLTLLCIAPAVTFDVWAKLWWFFAMTGIWQILRSAYNRHKQNESGKTTARKNLENAMKEFHE